MQRTTRLKFLDLRSLHQNTASSKNPKSASSTFESCRNSDSHLSGKLVSTSTILVSNQILLIYRGALHSIFVKFMHQSIATPKSAKSAMTFDSPLKWEPNPSSTPVLLFSIKFPSERVCLLEKKSWLRKFLFWTTHQTADGVKNPKKAFNNDYWRDSYTSFAINTDLNSSCEVFVLNHPTRDQFGWSNIEIDLCVKNSDNPGYPKVPSFLIFTQNQTHLSS